MLCCYISTLGTNIHKQELFVMAIRTPTGKTFPGNYIIIPSSKKWLFHSIFCLAFLSLYGEHACSMNQFILTDEEDAEYHAFETMIATHDAFCSPKVMLCTFHAVWQPFCVRAWEYLYEGSYYLDQGNVILMVFFNTYMMGLLRRIISWLCQ
jgi:hypothetical protein